MLTHNDFMQIAIEEAKRSTQDVPVGAIIVQQGKIIVKKHNLKEELNDVTAHAEILSIREAEKLEQNWRLKNAIMYVTLEPCPMCMSAIINSRISELYFGAYDNLYGAAGSILDLKSIYNSKIKITGGICENECSELLKNIWRKHG